MNNNNNNNNKTLNDYHQLKFDTWRSYKNPSFIYNLNNKQLVDYYDCLLHHRSKHHNCKNSKSASPKNEERCCYHYGSHFCTKTAQQLMAHSKYCDYNNRNNNESISMDICDNYKPSFTSKSDQLDDIYDKVRLLKESKKEMKKTLRTIDKSLIDDSSYSNNFNDSDIKRY
jgi:hypothetical protein